jgi:hypothetical protein
LKQATATIENTAGIDHTSLKVSDAHPQPARLYEYDGRSWMVPKNFKFPRCRLKGAFEYWHYGDMKKSTEMDNGMMQRTPIRPFKELCPHSLPATARKEYEQTWKPILTTITEECQSSDYTTVRNWLKTKKFTAELANKTDTYFNWQITKWAKKMSQWAGAGKPQGIGKQNKECGVEDEMEADEPATQEESENETTVSVSIHGNIGQAGAHDIFIDDDADGDDLGLTLDDHSDTQVGIFDYVDNLSQTL